MDIQCAEKQQDAYVLYLYKVLTFCLSNIIFSDEFLAPGFHRNSLEYYKYKCFIYVGISLLLVYR